MGTDPRAPLVPLSRAPASRPPAFLLARPPRWRGWLWLLALAVFAGLLPSLGGQPAHAAPLVDSFSPLPSSGEGTASHLSFQGGWIQQRPEVYLVFWGPMWDTDNTHIATKNQVIATFSVLAGSQYNNILTQYNNPNDTANLDDYVHNDVRVMGYMTDSTTPSALSFDSCGVLPPGLGVGVEAPLHTVVGNCAIRAEAVRALHSFGVQPDPSTLVLVLPQQGSTYQLPPCGIHSYDSYDFSQSFTYAYARYADSGSNCMFTGDTPQSTAWTAVHEYAEAATDPNIYLTASTEPIRGSGWQTGEAGVYGPHEVGDLCENYKPVNGDIWDSGKGPNGDYYTDSSGNRVPWPTYHPTNTGLSLMLPFLWSRASNGCVMSMGQEFSSADGVTYYGHKHTVQGVILNAYNAMGGPASWLGTPTTEEYPTSGGREQAFEHGVIFRSSSTSLIMVSSYVGYTIASVAIGQVGGTCGQYYNCEAPGEWCSDFARWVWSMSGVNVSGLSAWAASFYDYGLRYGTLSSTPHVGDAVVYGYNPGTDFAAHVAIVTSVNVDNHTITSIGGNERGGAGIVAADGPYDWSVGGSPTGQVISGYVSPSGTFPNGNGGGNPGVVPTPPGGTAPPSGYVAPTAHYWVDTFANAPGYGANGAVVGTLYAGTSYVFCRQWGNQVSDSSGNFNHWWLWTDLDTGGKGWVSAYYLSRWGNDVAKDNSGVDIPACWAGSSGGGGTTGVPAPPGGSPPPNGYTAPTTYYWVDTFASAPGYGSSGAQVGTLYAATNYVYCKEWGTEKSDSSGNYNHWWLWTDLDTGGQGWVSAYYLSLWGNDVAKDNSGNVIPNCS